MNNYIINIIRFCTIVDNVTVSLSKVYHKRDPSTADEIEMLENLFDCLCSSLMQCPANCERFLRGEGLQLMILMLRLVCEDIANVH